MRDEPVDAAPRIAQDSRNLLREPHEVLAVLAPQRLRQRWRPGTFVRLALDDNVPTRHRRLVFTKYHTAVKTKKKIAVSGISGITVFPVLPDFFFRQNGIS